jgi:uncharacterized protein YjiS (DUF1127 family)
MTTLTRQSRHTAFPAFRPSLAAIVERVGHWMELRRQRRELLSLSDDMLKDIGISRADVLREADKSFWQD